MLPSISKAKKADEVGAGPSSQQQHPPAVAMPPAAVVTGPNMGEGDSTADSGAAAASLLGSSVGPSTAVSPRRAVPAAAAASVATGPSTLLPAIIRPVIVRPAVAAAGSSALCTAAAPRQIIRPMAVASPSVYDPTGPQQQATGAAAAGASARPATSALTAVQRVRRIVEQSKERAKQSKEEQEIECVICLDRPKSTVLRPCGHVQMCLECCQEHMAIAESKGVKAQVIESCLQHRRFLFYSQSFSFISHAVPHVPHAGRGGAVALNVRGCPLKIRCIFFRCLSTGPLKFLSTQAKARDHEG